MFDTFCYFVLSALWVLPVCELLLQSHSLIKSFCQCVKSLHFWLTEPLNFVYKVEKRKPAVSAKSMSH